MRFCLVVLLLAGATSADADVLRLRNQECPAGSYATNSHSGSWCVVRACERCRGRCAPMRICTQSATFTVRGRFGALNGYPTRETTIVVNSCGPNERCNGALGSAGSATPTGPISCSVQDVCLVSDEHPDLPAPTKRQVPTLSMVEPLADQERQDPPIVEASLPETLETPETPTATVAMSTEDSGGCGGCQVSPTTGFSWFFLLALRRRCVH